MKLSIVDLPWLRMALADASVKEDWAQASALCQSMLTLPELQEDSRVAITRKLLVYQKLAGLL